MNEINDYELVNLAQENNEDARNILFDKYTPLIIKKSKDALNMVNHHGIDIADIIQECYIAFDEAINNFNQDEAASFYTFSMLCVERRITNYIRTLNNKRSMVLNEAVPLDESIDKLLVADDNIEDNFMVKSDESSRIIQLIDELTPFEKKVFNYKSNGYSFEEIAKMLNKDIKSVYNTFWRIKNKYKKIKEIDD